MQIPTLLKTCTTPTAAFVTSVSECNSGMKRTSSDYLNSEIPDNTAPTTALKDSIAENNTVDISMALEYLADSYGFENTTPAAARDVSIVESKDVKRAPYPNIQKTPIQKTSWSPPQQLHPLYTNNQTTAVKPQRIVTLS